MADARAAIRSAEQKLETARFGLADMKLGSDRFDAGLMNAVVFGRMVTIALQNMATSTPEFGAWYEAHRDSLKSDPLMRFFVRMRNEIEKQVKDHKSSHVHVRNLDLDILRRFPRPPGASSFFIGDSLGRSGWKFELPNGEEEHERYYVIMPEGIVQSKICLDGVPEEYSDVEAVELVERYLGKLECLVAEARSKFW